MATMTGGDKFDAYMKKLADSVKSNQVVKVGFFSGATYPDGTPVAEVAATNEYGVPSRGQPPRPFFRNMIAENKSQWPRMMASRLKENDYNANVALQLMGNEIAKELILSIWSLWSPPLAASTVKRKGFDKPLIESETMVNDVAWRVEQE